MKFLNKPLETMIILIVLICGLIWMNGRFNIIIDELGDIKREIKKITWRM